jgi:hypothetical protein
MAEASALGSGGAAVPIKFGYPGKAAYIVVREEVTDAERCRTRREAIH